MAKYVRFRVSGSILTVKDGIEEAHGIGKQFDSLSEAADYYEEIENTENHHNIRLYGVEETTVRILP